MFLWNPIVRHHARKTQIIFQIFNLHVNEDDNAHNIIAVFIAVFSPYLLS